MVRRRMDETPIQDALRYARNERIALRPFLDDGRLAAYNSISELNLRRRAPGGRNWLFLSGDDGAFANVHLRSAAD
jgi:transposase